MIFKIDAECLL